MLAVPTGIAAFTLGSGTGSERAGHGERAGRPLAELASALRSRAYRAAASANLAEGFAVMGVRSALVPLFVHDVLHRSATWTGIGFGVTAAVNAATLLPGGRAADVLGRRPVIVAGCTLAATGLVMLALLPDLGGFLAALVVLGLGSGLLDVAPAAMIGDLLGGQGGTVVAAYQMSGDIGTVAGPIAVGFLVDSVSYAAAFGLGAGVLASAAIMGLFAPETRRPVAEATPVAASAS
jgi:MFS family permease